MHRLPESKLDWKRKPPQSIKKLNQLTPRSDQHVSSP